MNKKIVIAANSSWSIYNFRLNLMRSLKEAGYKVIIVAPYDKYSDNLKKEFEYHNIWMNNKGTNPLEDLKTTYEYYKIYRRIKPYIALHFTIKPNIYGNLSCQLLGIKTINNISGLGTLFIKESLVTKIAKLLYKAALRKSSKVFFQNSDDKELFLQNRLIKENQCYLLPGSGVDIEKFRPIEYKYEDNIFRFLLIARMLWDKGIGEYVEAAKIIRQKYKNVEFQLLGPTGVANQTAISKETIENWVKDGIVKYLGETDDVRAFIKKAHCVVLPSYREGVPHSLLEACAMGKPVITTNSVGCKDLVDDGINGYLCEVKNPRDLAEKMEKMLNLSREKREKMGKAGREKMIREFDETIVIDKYLEAVKSIC